LDCLRGVAITLVFLHHVEGPINGLNAFRLGFGPWQALAIAGHTGVSLFFLLSGFLIVRPFLREIRGGVPTSRREYFRRRALRILPLYLTYILGSSGSRVGR